MLCTAYMQEAKVIDCTYKKEDIDPKINRPRCKDQVCFRYRKYMGLHPH